MSTSINMMDAEKIIIACYQADEPLMLLGKPGMGKTALFEAVAKKLDIGYIDFRLSLRDPVDVGGMRVPDVKTGILKHYIPEDLPDVKRHGPKGIVVFDEINVVGQLMQATAYGIIQERRNGAYKMAPGWVPMASGNRVSDRAAAQRLSTALGNRFCVQNVEPDLPSWLEQYGSQHCDTRGCAFLRFRPELFHLMPGENVRLPGATESSSVPVNTRDFEPFPSARSWTKAFKFIDQPRILRRKIYSGYVGEYAADEFEAFWRIMEAAPTLEQIIDEPTQAKLPVESDAGTYYAVAGMLARAVNRQNMGPIMVYVDRMIPDYQVALVTDAVRRQPKLKETKEYSAWIVKHQHITL